MTTHLTDGDTLSWYQKRDALVRVWIWFSISVSITHGCVTACVGLASVALGKHLGGVSSAILFFSYAITALVGSTWLTYSFGLKWSIVTSLLLLCVYVGAFLVATLSPSLSWPAAIIGGVLGGVAAGWLWTAQGLYFSRIAKYSVTARTTTNTTVKDGRKECKDTASDDTQAKEDKKPTSSQWVDSEANSLLSGIWGGIYVAAEVITRGISSVIFTYSGFGSTFGVFTALAVVAALSTILLPTPPEMKEEQLNEEHAEETKVGGRDSSDTQQKRQAKGPSYVRGRWSEKLIATGNLFYKSAVIRYMSTFNILFGVSLAFADQYMNAEIVAEGLGVSTVGWMTALVPVTAVLGSYPLSILGRTPSGKRIGLWIGGSIFLVVGIIAFSATPNQLRGLRYGIVFMYILLGAGRAVFETTNKAALVDFFPGEEATAAFSNLHTWSGLAFGISFIVYEYISQVAMGVIIFLVATLTIVSIWRVYEITGEPRVTKEGEKVVHDKHDSSVISGLDGKESVEIGTISVVEQQMTHVV